MPQQQIRFPTFQQYDAEKVVRGQTAMQNLQKSTLKMGHDRRVTELGAQYDDPEELTEAFRKEGFHAEADKTRTQINKRKAEEYKQTAQMITLQKQQAQMVVDQASYDELRKNLIQSKRLTPEQIPEDYMKGGKKMIRQFLLSAKQIEDYMQKDIERDFKTSEREASEEFKTS